MNKKEYINKLQRLTTDIEKANFYSRYCSPTLNDPFLSTMAIKFIRNNLLKIVNQATLLRPNGDKKKKIEYLACFGIYTELVCALPLLYNWFESILGLGEENE